MVFLYAKRGQKILHQYFKAILRDWNSQEILKKINIFSSFMTEKYEEITRNKYFLINSEGVIHKIGHPPSKDLFFEQKIKLLENKKNIDK